MKRLAATALLATAATATACVPPPAPQTCPDAARLAFKGTGVAERMVKISWRESRWDPTARNRRSSAVGCFQILATTHARRIRRLGFTAAQMTQAGPNAAVARSLYDDAGLSPWALTS